MNEGRAHSSEEIRRGSRVRNQGTDGNLDLGDTEEADPVGCRRGKQKFNKMEWSTPKAAASARNRKNESGKKEREKIQVT